MAVLTFYEPYGKEGLKHSASVASSQLKMTVVWLVFKFLQKVCLYLRGETKQNKTKQPNTTTKKQLLYDMSGLTWQAYCMGDLCLQQGPEVSKAIYFQK